MQRLDAFENRKGDAREVFRPTSDHEDELQSVGIQREQTAQIRKEAGSCLGFRRAVENIELVDQQDERFVLAQRGKHAREEVLAQRAWRIIAAQLDTLNRHRACYLLRDVLEDFWQGWRRLVLKV